MTNVNGLFKVGNCCICRTGRDGTFGVVKVGTELETLG